MTWEINGQYVETCNCDFFCPCGPSGLTQTTHGHCIFAMGMRVDSGHFDGTSLDGCSMVLYAKTGNRMIDGNWQVGLIVDDRASDAQRDALTAIISGQAGGPMANMAPLIGNFVGVERAPVKIDGRDKSWSVSAGGFVDQACEGAAGLGGDVMIFEGMGHPISNRLALARASKSHVHAGGIDWDQVDGKNNGHYAAFNWKG